MSRRVSLRVLFLSGYRSRPGGAIPSTIRADGHTIAEPDLPDDNFAQSLAIAQRVFHRHQPDVVVGWSRGGAVAMSIDTFYAPLVLLAPAWTHWGTVTRVKPEVIILHSPQDDQVSIEDSRQLIRNSGLPPEQIQAVGESHAMVDEAANRALSEAVRRLGKRSKSRRAA